MKKKWWLGLLSAFCAAVFSLGFSACDNSVNNGGNTGGGDLGGGSTVEKSEIEEVYDVYVVYTQSKGQKPLSYEEWLDSIRGKDGRGIVKVEIIKGYLWITYTDAPNKPVNVGKVQDVCDHSWSAWEVLHEPTCEKKGFRARECSKCGEVESDLVGTGACSFTHYESNNDATCEADGTKTATCDYGCGETSVVRDVGSALGHDHSVFVETVSSATCTAHQVDKYKCSRCDSTENKTVANTALGHSYTEYVGVAQEATCTSDRKDEYKCERCTDTEERVVEDTALGHNHTEYVGVAQEATCTSDRKDEYKCERCTDTEERVVEDTALGHSYTEYVGVAQEATCTTNRIDTYKCERCTDTENREIANTAEHKFGANWVTDETHHWHACTGANCQVVSDHGEHGWDSGMLSGSTMTYTCTTCGKTKSEATGPRTTITEEEWIAAMRSTNFTISISSEEEYYTTEQIKCTGEIVEIQYEYDYDWYYTPYIYHYLEDDGLWYVVRNNSFNEWQFEGEYNNSLDGYETVVFGQMIFYFYDYVSPWYSLLYDEESKEYYFDQTAAYLPIDISARFSFENGKLIKVSWGLNKVWEIVDQGTTSISLPENIHIHRFDQMVEDDMFAYTHPTCTTPGEYFYSCTCGVSNMMGETFVGGIPGHDYSIYVGMASEATCEEDQKETYQCSRCDSTEDIDVIGTALGHAYTEYVGVAQEATCATNRKDEHKCSRCDSTEEREVAGTALGHSYTVYVGVAHEATCTSDRIDEYKCERCTDTEDKVVADTMVGHVYLQTWTTDGEYHWHACTNVECTSVSDHGEHSWENDVCSICSATRVSQGLEYTLSTDKTYYIVTGIGTCTDTEIIIPETYEEKPVKEIGDAAFYNCRNLTSIIISDGVTSIGYASFASCKNLTKIEIPNSVTSIGKGAFDNCHSLTEIVIPESVTSIGDVAFLDCEDLTSIVVNESNTAYKSIDGNLYTKDGKTLIQYAIGKTESSFTIPDGVTSIGKKAFYNGGSFSSISIPESVTSISNDAFYGCSFNVIEVDENNTAYKSIDGDLYTKDGSTLIRYTTRNASDTTFVVPESVTTIADRAFASCNNLSSVTIGKGVTSIGEYAFDNCNNLRSVTFEDNSQLTIIGSCAFNCCWSLTEIEFGTNSQLTDIGSGAFKGCSSLVEIVLPDKVETIGEYAFSGCSSLVEMVIPESVTGIKGGVWKDCDSLTSLVFEDISTWYRTTSLQDWKNKTDGTEIDVTSATNNVTMFVNPDGTLAQLWYKL